MKFDEIRPKEVEFGAYEQELDAIGALSGHRRLRQAL